MLLLLWFLAGPLEHSGSEDGLQRGMRIKRTSGGADMRPKSAIYLTQKYNEMKEPLASELIFEELELGFRKKGRFWLNPKSLL